MPPLKGKVALVTGGSRGIGAGIARQLAKDGADVAITYVSSPEKARAVVAEIEKLGVRGLAIQADSADADAVKAAVDKTAAELGRLDILVNNAGIYLPRNSKRPRRRIWSRCGRQRARADHRHSGGDPAHERWRPHHHHRELPGRARGRPGRHACTP